MASTNSSDNGARGDGGVLANLPRTRPQRATARRAASRGAASDAARTRKNPSPKRPAAHPLASAAAPEKTTVSPLRDSSASATAKQSAGKRAPRPAATPKRKPAPRKSAARRNRPIDEPAPRQGFECDGEAPGSSIQPPGGAELVASAAEIVGELAKASVSTGERLLKDVLSRLPL